VGVKPAAAAICSLTEKIDGERVRLAKYSPYALRHYYASKLIEKGKDLKFIQHAMGHSKIEITLNIYGHLLKARDNAHKGVAEELAAEILRKHKRHSTELHV